jgi:hypothetical protein
VKHIFSLNTSGTVFLDQHGTNPKHEGKRLSGSDSVNKEAFKELLKKGEC